VIRYRMNASTPGPDAQLTSQGFIVVNDGRGRVVLAERGHDPFRYRVALELIETWAAENPSAELEIVEAPRVQRHVGRG